METIKSEDAVFNFKQVGIITAIALVIGIIFGFYIGHTWFERVTKVEVPTISQNTEHVSADGTAELVAKYVKGEIGQFAKPGSQSGTINYITNTTATKNADGGYDTSTTTLPDVEYTAQKTDMKVNFGFDQFNVLANGKPISFTKDQDENFMFQKNELDWKIGVKVNADVTIPEQKPRPQAGPYITTRSAGLMVSAPNNKGDDTVFTITTPYRDRHGDSSLDNVEVGVGFTKRF